MTARPRWFLALAALAWAGVPLVCVLPAGAAGDARVMRNLTKPEHVTLEAVPLEIRDRNLALGGMQAGAVPADATEFDLGTFEGVQPPCRSAQLDGVGISFAVVCPDADGVEHVLYQQQGSVLRYPVPLVPRSQISLSDDGARVAAILAEEDGPVLHVLDIQGTRDISLVGLKEPRDPVLAGSGGAVACSCLVGKRRHVVVVDLLTADARVVSGELEDVNVGAISANGRRVAFKASHGGWDDFYLTDLDRKLRHNVSDSEGDTVAVDLSQDGDTVVFVQRFGGAMGIFTADISSRKVANRSGVLGSVVDVIVSASGTRHAFLKGGLSPRIEVWDTKGKKESQVASVAEGCWEPTMSSDGRFVGALCAREGREASLLTLFPLPEPE